MRLGLFFDPTFAFSLTSVPCLVSARFIIYGRHSTSTRMSAVLAVNLSPSRINTERSFWILLWILLVRLPFSFTQGSCLLSLCYTTQWLRRTSRIKCLTSLINNMSVTRPPRRNVVGDKWVFRVKRSADGNIVQGPTRRKGVHANRMRRLVRRYSLVARLANF